MNQIINQSANQSGTAYLVRCPLYVSPVFLAPVRLQKLTRPDTTAWPAWAHTIQLGTIDSQCISTSFGKKQESTYVLHFNIAPPPLYPPGDGAGGGGGADQWGLQLIAECRCNLQSGQHFKIFSSSYFMFLDRLSLNLSTLHQELGSYALKAFFFYFLPASKTLET